MKGSANFVLVALVFILLAGVGYFIYSQGRSGVNFGANKAPVYSTETGNVTSGNISLDVTSPSNGATLSSVGVVVKGKTSAAAEVFVNDKETKADSAGNFSVSLTLDEGENQIIVSANDDKGNSAEKDLTVTVETFQ